MKNLKRLLAGILSAAVLLSLTGVTFAAGKGDTFTLGIYSTTDMHGKCYDRDPISGKEVEDSYLKVASAMTRERSRNDGVLLIDNGGVLQGSSIISYNLNVDGGKDNPVAQCLRYCGYDAFIPGDSEVKVSRESWQGFRKILTSQNRGYSGQPVSVLWANAQAAGESGDTAPYLIRSYTVAGREFRVGVLGLGWEETGLSYAQEWTTRWQQELRQKEKCDFVIVSVHGGTGAGETDQVARLIGSTTGIDLVIAGHDHRPGISSLLNAGGKEVPVVNGGGSALTKTQVTVGSDGSFTVERGELVELAGYENDVGLKRLMEPYYTPVEPKPNWRLGVLNGNWEEETDLIHVQSDTMDLIHEAQLWATGAQVSMATPGEADGSWLGGLLKEANTATIRVRDCYSLCPDVEDRLCVVEMTGGELRSWLERSAQDYTVGRGGVVAGGGAGSDQIYGISYDIFLGNPEGKRVINMTYEGRPMEDDQLFRVAVSARRLAVDEDNDPYGWYAVTEIGLDSPAVVWDGADSAEFGHLGGSRTLILAEYLKSFTAQGNAILPPERRSRWSLSAATSEDAVVPVTRLEFVEKLYVAAGRPSAYLDLSQTFSDIDGENPAAAWAVQAGIVVGNGAGEFLPNLRLSREQAAVMLYRYDIARGAGPTGAWAVRVPYTDAVSVAVWASEAVMWNVIRGYFPADRAGNFGPQQALTAAELKDAIGALGK